MNARARAAAAEVATVLELTARYSGWAELCTLASLNGEMMIRLSVERRALLTVARLVRTRLHRRLLEARSVLAAQALLRACGRTPNPMICYRDQTRLMDRRARCGPAESTRSFPLMSFNSIVTFADLTTG